MPLIEVSMYAGRSAEMKERLISSVSECVAETLGISIDEVIVVLKDIDPQDWAVGGVSTRRRREESNGGT